MDVAYLSKVSLLQTIFVFELVCWINLVSVVCFKQGRVSVVIQITVSIVKVKLFLKLFLYGNEQQILYHNEVVILDGNH